MLLFVRCEFSLVVRNCVGCGLSFGVCSRWLFVGRLLLIVLWFVVVWRLVLVVYVCLFRVGGVVFDVVIGCVLLDVGCCVLFS